MTQTVPKGFTLVELLVVFVIIAVLSTVGFATYSNAQKSARDAKRKADLNQINLYLQYYYSDNGKYPQAGNSCAYGSNCYVFSTSGDSWIPALTSGGYTQRLPVDPINNAGNGPWVEGRYSYSYGNVTSDGQGYDLTAQLENPSDPDRCGVKNWRFFFDHRAWCFAFGGNYSNQIYEASPDR